MIFSLFFYKIPETSCDDMVVKIQTKLIHQWFIMSHLYYAIWKKYICNSSHIFGKRRMINVLSIAKSILSY